MIKLTPFKLLIGVVTDEDVQNFEEYQDQLNEIHNEYSDDVVRDSKLNSLKKPKLAEPEYKIAWYNMEHYIIDTWTADWDTKHECSCIISTFFNTLTEEMHILNLQYGESEWKEILKQLDYYH